MLARRTNSARLAGVLVYMKCCVFASAFTCSLFAANAQAGPVRIALLAEAQIPGDAIVLADLLPADVHGKIRALADSILLGKTPQSGTWRYLNGPLVEETIEHTGISAANFDIPGVIAVQRLDRPLGGEEILANMRRSLGRFSLSSGEELALLALREDDVVWDAALRVPLGDARLRVQEILVDLSAGRAQFRMTAQSQAHGVPFDVIGNLPRPELLSESLADAPDAAARLASQAASREHSLASGESDVADAPVLIVAGHPAQLRLRSPNSSILLEVLALQVGHLGETIRVRMPTTGRILRARVVGLQSLDAIF